MELAEKVKDKEIIKFKRRVGPEEIKDLLKYLKTEVSARLNYNIKENIIINKGKEKNYLLGCSGAFFNESNIANRFSCNVKLEYLKAESLELMNPNGSFPYESECLKFWEEIRDATNKYFKEHPKKK